MSQSSDGISQRSDSTSQRSDVTSQRSDGTSHLASPELRTIAVSYLLEDSERAGLALSPEVQDQIRKQCFSLFDYKRDPAGAVAFSRSLKDIAVRLFRQRRYREAVARYELAATFNLADPTLVSNRATCMYNMSKFRTCINLCLDCITHFPTLFYENPMLYFKVLLRMGRANVELKNFTEAQATFDALTSMKTGINSSVKLTLPEGQLEKLLIPFENHLKTKLEMEGVSTDAYAGSAATPLNARPSEDEEDEEDCDFDEENDEDVVGIVALSDLCPHIYEYGRGPCMHSFPSDDHGPSCHCLEHDDDMSDTYAQSYQSGESSMPELLSTSENEEMSDNSTSSKFDDGSMPDLVSDEVDSFSGGDDEGGFSDDDYSRNDGWDGTGSHKSRSPSQGIVSKQSSNNTLNSSSGGGSQSSPKSVERPKAAPIDWRNAWKESTLKSQPSPKTSLSSRKAAKDSKRDSFSAKGRGVHGFKRGFLQSKPLILDEDIGKQVQADGKRVVSPGFSKKWSATCYETDEEIGPIGSGLFVERLDEDEALIEYENAIDSLSPDINFDFSSCLREVLGKSFLTNRTIDFTRIFGHHQVANMGKRKKKSCDKNCGTCFARKMWKARFISTDQDTAEAAIDAVDTDYRRDRNTFLTSELWQGTGYYASGYEMAYDVPALVHGVAYICHLQSELYWRGDKITLIKDVQHSFISALENNYHKEGNNLHFLFMVFFMLRDTVNLFGLFPDPEHESNRRSFQFSNSASYVANNAISRTGNRAATAGGKNQVLMASRSDSLAHNVHSWSTIGHMANEEKWVYNLLLRDVSNLMIKITGATCKAQPYLAGSSFSDAFERACGERSNDDKHWKTRVVSVVARERSRLIERTAFEAKEAGDLDKSISLYTVSIQSRPHQPRLYYRRAAVRYDQGKLRDAMNDVHRGIQVVHEKPLAVQSTRCDSTRKCLLQSLHVLQGDIHLANSKGEEDSSVPSLKSAIGSYNKALNVKSTEKISTDQIRNKLSVVKELYTMAQAQSRIRGESVSSGAAVTDTSKSAKPQPGKGKKGGTASTGNVTAKSKVHAKKTTRISRNQQQKNRNADANASSSEEEDSVPAFGGNRYGALRDNAGPVSFKQMKRNTITVPPLHSRKGWETVGGRARGNQTKSSLPTSSTRQRNPAQIPRGSKRAGSSAIGSNAPSGSVTPSNELRGSSASSSRELLCDLCDMKFGGERDYSRHMRGRRHRTAFADARAAGKLPSKGTQKAGGSAQAPVEATAQGPTLAEAATEAERAMAILGGEARPSDVVLRMNFSKWGIRDVNEYLQSHFGGLLQLCNQHPQTFEVAHGALSRTMILLVDRSGFASERRTTTRRGFLTGSAAFPTLPDMQGSSSAQVDYRSRMADVTAILNEVKLSAGTAEEITGEYVEGLCGICLDDREDVRIIPCKHKWCERCIMANLAKERVVCPTCNGKVECLERLSNDLD